MNANHQYITFQTLKPQCLALGHEPARYSAKILALIHVSARSRRPARIRLPSNGVLNTDGKVGVRRIARARNGDVNPSREDARSRGSDQKNFRVVACCAMGRFHGNSVQ